MCRNFPPRLSGTSRLLILMVAAVSSGLRADEPDGERPILEFRILADRTHDAEAVAKAMAPEGLEHPPEGYRWAPVGERVAGGRPTVEGQRLSDRDARWEPGEFAGARVELRGKNRGGSEYARSFAIEGNTAEALELRESPEIYFSDVAGYQIDRIPSRLSEGPSVVLREGPRESGRSRVWVLLRPDEFGLDEKGLRRAEPTIDERREPALLVEFNDEGARKLGALTRACLPEDGGALLHHVAFLIEGRVISAPVVRSEIRDRAIIEGFSAEERDRLLERLRASIEGRERPEGKRPGRREGRSGTAGS